MEHKYKIDRSDSVGCGDGVAYRIIAIRDFNDVKRGEKGGYISSEKNLSDEGDCWVYDQSVVLNDARVEKNARVFGNCCVKGSAIVTDNSEVSGKCILNDNVQVSGSATVSGKVYAYGNVCICQNADVDGIGILLEDNAVIKGFGKVMGCARMSGDSRVEQFGQLYDEAYIAGNTCIAGNAQVGGNTGVMGDDSRIGGDVRFESNARIFGNTSVFESRDVIVINRWWKDGDPITWLRNPDVFVVDGEQYTIDALLAFISHGYKNEEHYYRQLIFYTRLAIGNCIEDALQWLV